MTEKEILETAARTERDGIEFYHQAAREGGNPMVQRMYEAFVKEEEKHLDYILTLMDDREIERRPSELMGQIRTIFTEAPEELRTQARATDSDREAIAFALKIEEEAYNLYARWAEEAETQRARDLCSLLANEENDHYRLFTNMNEYLDRTSDWFMRDEGWIFDGG